MSIQSLNCLALPSPEMENCASDLGLVSHLPSAWKRNGGFLEALPGACHWHFSSVFNPLDLADAFRVLFEHL